MVAAWAELACDCSISGESELDVPVDVPLGERRLGDRLREQAQRSVQPGHRNVQDGLQPGQRDLDAESGSLGLQQLGELLAVVLAAALVEHPGAHRGHTLPVPVLDVEGHVEH